ncbi:hypothetical protein FBEOM_10093 [Fusarium beomiforme]|uniref:Uncharacterized protein n=1 Tax=Fusarium beomiforme TaxID=44412 RepID=A0A9P5AD27_9HYPO|nr:hypothetical protein FBEOM_10093 [Fusarium beomiforme]
MASLLVTGGLWILSNVGKSILSKGAGWVFDQGLASINGGSDNDKIRQDIANVLAEVKQVETSVADLSSQLSDTLLQLRKDDLGTYITDIQTYYSTIGDIMQEAFDLPNKNLTDSVRVTQAEALQSRLDNRLQASADNVPGYLDQINAFLNDAGPNSFFKQAAQQAFDESDDFLGVYTKTTVMALNYWVAYAKGLSLLQMALDNPKVNFEEGSYTISRHNTNFLAQEQNLQDTIGQETISLAQGVLSNPIGTNNFIWRVHSGLYVQDATDTYSSCVISWEETPHNSWSMVLDPPITADQFDPTASYPVVIIPSDLTTQMLCIGGQYGMQMQIRFTDETIPQACRWFIKPRNPGADRFSFEFVSNYMGGTYNGSYAVDVPWPNWGPKYRLINYVDALHNEDGNQFFNVTLDE